MPDEQTYAGNGIGGADVSLGMGVDGQTRAFVKIGKEMVLRALSPHL